MVLKMKRRLPFTRYMKNKIEKDAENMKKKYKPLGYISDPTGAAESPEDAERIIGRTHYFSSWGKTKEEEEKLLEYEDAVRVMYIDTAIEGERGRDVSYAYHDKSLFQKADGTFYISEVYCDDFAGGQNFIADYDKKYFENHTLDDFVFDLKKYAPSFPYDGKYLSSNISFYAQYWLTVSGEDLFGNRKYWKVEGIVKDVDMYLKEFSINRDYEILKAHLEEEKEKAIQEIKKREKREKIFFGSFLSDEDGWRGNCHPLASKEYVDEQIHIIKNVVDRKSRKFYEAKVIRESPQSFSALSNFKLFTDDSFGYLIAIENCPEIESHNCVAGPDNPGLYNINLWKEMGKKEYNIQVPTRPCGPEDAVQNKRLGNWLYDLCSKNGSNIWYGKYRANDFSTAKIIVHEICSNINVRDSGFFQRFVLNRCDLETFCQILKREKAFPEVVLKVIEEHDFSMEEIFYSFENDKHMCIEKRGDDLISIDFIETVK